MATTEFQEWVRLASFAPIFICSIVGMTVTLWKWQMLRRPVLPSAPELARIQDEMRLGHFGAVAAIARVDGSRLARLLESAFRDAQWSSRSGERLARGGAELARELEYGLGALSLIATLGPLFGLLGTVVGITLVFDQLAAAADAATAQQLAGGIGTALHTTIGGLIVGVLALVTHRYFSAKVDDHLAQLDGARMELVEIVSEDTP